MDFKESYRLVEDGLTYDEVVNAYRNLKPTQRKKRYHPIFKENPTRPQYLREYKGSPNFMRYVRTEERSAGETTSRGARYRWGPDRDNARLTRPETFHLGPRRFEPSLVVGPRGGVVALAAVEGGCQLQHLRGGAVSVVGMGGGYRRRWWPVQGLVQRWCRWCGT